MKKTITIFLLIIAGSFSFISCNKEGNKVLAEYLLNNQRQVLYKKLVNKENIRIKNRLLDSVWFTGAEFIMVMPEILTESQELTLGKLITDDLFNSNNTIITYHKNRPDTLLKSFHSLIEKENVGFHFVLLSAEKEVHIFDIDRMGNIYDTAYYLRLNRKF